MRHVGITILIFLLICASGTTMAAEKLSVFVSILPQKYFVEKIGGTLTAVSVMVEPGGNPHSYEPKPRQMAELSKAGIYFAAGVQFEDVWLKRFAALNPDMLVIHTEEGIEKLPMRAYSHHEDAHDKAESHETEHSHGTKDPHIWLSPPLVKIQAENILKGLVKADPNHQAEYDANYKAFIHEIDALDGDIRKIFAGKQGVQFMVFHPSWGYFAHAYGLEQVPVEIEGKSPKPAELGRLINHAKEHGIQVVFVQPQFSAASAEVIAEAIGGQVMMADPLAENWAVNLRQAAEKFRSALK